MRQRLRFSIYVIKHAYYKWVVITFIIWPFLRTHQPTNFLPQTLLSQTDPNRDRRLWVGQVILHSPIRWDWSIKTFHVEPTATSKCCVTASAWMLSSLCRQFPFIFGRLGNMRQSPVWALQMTRMPHMPLPEVLFIFQTFMYYSSLCVCVCWQMKI